MPRLQSSSPPPSHALAHTATVTTTIPTNFLLLLLSYPFLSLLLRYQEAIEAGKEAFFLRSTSAPFGYPRNSSERTIVLAIGRAGGARNNGRSNFFSVQKPNTGYHPQDCYRGELSNKIRVRVGADDWDDDDKLTKAWNRLESSWTRQYERATNSCMHFNCKNQRAGRECNGERRE
jgi:hypothetical protein